MITTKSQTTISFNTEEYLKTKLNELVKNEKIIFYCYIRHLGEEDTKKNHIHLFIEPNGKLDTLQLREYFQELDLDNLTKPPLGCLPFQKTDNKYFGDWYLYVLHDIDYLIEKNLDRQYHYKEEDFITNDIEYLEYKKSQINFTAINKKTQLKEYIKKGYTFNEVLALSNLIPINQLHAYKSLYQALEIFLQEEREKKENGK